MGPASYTRGFTLIELLVVIAIIGILSATVLVSLNTARGKAADAAIRREVQQLALVAELNYQETGSYYLNAGWDYVPADCANSFGSMAATHRDKARELCQSILRKADRMHTGVNGSLGYNAIDNYAIMVRLPSKGTYLCRGSSGATSDTSTGNWTHAGCYSNP